MAGERTVKRAPVDVTGGWPVDGEGNPLAQITYAVSNTVPTGDYANVVVGPAAVTKFVDDNADAIGKAFDEVAVTTEKALGFRREQLLERLRS